MAPADGPGGAPHRAIGDFFSGGLDYNTALGTLNTPHGRIDLKTDHNKLGRGAGALYDAIAAMSPGGRQLLPDDGYVKLSNLEYSTAALDEIAPNSNTHFQALAQRIDTHAGALTGANPADVVTPIPSGGGRFTGVPVPQMRRWLGGYASDAGFTRSLAALRGDVGWEMYVQATVGVLPSGLGTLYAAHEPPMGPLASAKDDVRRATVVGVQGLLADGGYQATLSSGRPTPTSISAPSISRR